MARKWDDLNEQQRLFLQVLFRSDVKGNIEKAMELADYKPTYKVALIKLLKDEIIELAEEVLAKGAPSAAFTLIDTASGEGDEFVSNTRIEAAKQVLDRVGLSRKDRLDINITSPSGIFILPPKNEGDIS